MSHHPKHHAHAGDAHPKTAYDQGPPPGPQLEPENYLLEYQLASSIDPNPNPWEVLATIVVDPVNETWTVDRKALTVLARTGSIRLSSGWSLDRLPAVPNALVEVASTTVTWRGPVTDPRYPETGSSFAGDYVGSAGKRLAINFQTKAVTGGAAITMSYWYNPDATPVDLKASGGRVTLDAITGGYAGTCYTTTSSNSYTP